MRPRVIVALASLALAILLGFAGRSSGTEVLFTISGLLLLVAIVAGIASLSFWARIMPPLPPMPGLFDKPGQGQRWCTRCGSVTLAQGACSTCGHQVRAKAPRDGQGKPAKVAKTGEPRSTMKKP